MSLPALPYIPPLDDEPRTGLPIDAQFRPVNPHQGRKVGPSGWRKLAETVNNILNFTFDDSRKRTADEIAAGVTPTNFAYPPGNVLRYGTSNAIQTAINAAGTSGEIVIPNEYTGTDTYTNPNNLAVLDYRNSQLGVWSVISPALGVQSGGTTFTQGNDLVLRAAGSGDLRLEHLNMATTTAATLSVGTNASVLVGPINVGNVLRGAVRTGTTALLTTLPLSVPLMVGRETANEEVVPAGSWSIVDGTHLSITCANTHSGTTDIEIIGSTMLSAWDLFITANDVKPSQETGSNPQLRVRDLHGSIIARIPSDLITAFPRALLQWGAILAGYNGANQDLLYQHSLSTSQTKWRNAAGSNLTTLDNTGRWTIATGSMAGNLQSPAFAASFTPDASLGKHVVVGTLTANITINAPINAAIGSELAFQFVQGGAGGFTVTWNAAFIRPGWSDTGNVANARSSIVFVCIDGTNWLPVGAQKAYS